MVLVSVLGASPYTLKLKRLKDYRIQKKKKALNVLLSFLKNSEISVDMK